MPGLSGLRVIAFETRRAKELEALITKQGGAPFVAPALRETPLKENPLVFQFAEKLFAGEIDVVIFLTGVGTRALVEILKTRYALAVITGSFQKILSVARGPKPVAALAEIGIKPSVAVPEPNTWREILAVLDRQFPVRSKCVAVQEYGAPARELVCELENRGARVLAVPIYRWALPEDCAPLREAVSRIAQQKAEVVFWTNAQQILHAFQIAREIQLEPEFRRGLTQMLNASIGPTTSEALREQGISVAFEPTHSKMGVLVTEIAREAGRLMKKN